MRDGLRRELLAQKVLEREVTEKAIVTDAEVSAFYDANRAQFNLPEDAYHIAQIVVTPVREPQPSNRTGDDATTPEAAARKAQGLMERLKAGAPFSRAGRRLLRGPAVGPAGRRHGPGADVGAAPGAAGAARCGAEGHARHGQRRQRRRRHTLVLLVSQEKAGQRDRARPGCATASPPTCAAAASSCCAPPT